MTYFEAEQYLYSFTNLPRQEYARDRRDPIEYVRRMDLFLEVLGHPERRLRHVIHVTGTSGKGSVCLMLESILRSAGRTTGVYLSPHPTYLRERWLLKGRPISERDFVRTVLKLKDAVDVYARHSDADILSVFDLMTAFAFLYFSDRDVDWAIVEVGLGGRYDSTNVFAKKDVAVITNIGLDHTDILGHTKEEIARDKAGIITDRCQVYTSDVDPNIQLLLTHAAKQRQANFHIVKKNHAYPVPALGDHQAHNAALSAAICSDIGVGERAIRRGLARVSLPLRLEIISNKPTIFLDGAHNPDKMATTVLTVTELSVNKKQGGKPPHIHLVIGFSGDKDWPNMIAQLAALSPATVACTRNTIDPARIVADPRAIQKQVCRHMPTTTSEVFSHPWDAFLWARKHAAANDILLVTGSIFLSGQLRGYRARIS